MFSETALAHVPSNERPARVARMLGIDASVLDALTHLAETLGAGRATIQNRRDPKYRDWLRDQLGGLGTE
jgi:hypothetical protein